MKREIRTRMRLTESSLPTTHNELPTLAKFFHHNMRKFSTIEHRDASLAPCYITSRTTDVHHTGVPTPFELSHQDQLRNAKGDQTNRTWAMGELPPGYRFYPTEEELVRFYLRHKLDGSRRADIERVIPVVDVCSLDPWQLPGTYTCRSFQCCHGMHCHLITN